MATDQEIKQRVLSLMRDRMFQSGYSKVTLDEISSELGISKKTLYKFFSGKEDLAMQAVRYQFFEIETRFNAIFAASLPFTEKLHNIMMAMREMVGKFSSVAIQDMRKYAPQLWNEIELLRRERIFTKMEIMIGHAREEGVLRADVDERMLVKILLASADAVANPEMQAVLSKPLHEIVHSMFRIIFEGALTDEARAHTPIFFRADTAQPHEQ